VEWKKVPNFIVYSLWVEGLSRLYHKAPRHTRRIVAGPTATGKQSKPVLALLQPIQSTERVANWHARTAGDSSSNRPPGPLPSEQAVSVQKLQDYGVPSHAIMGNIFFDALNPCMECSLLPNTALPYPSGSQGHAGIMAHLCTHTPDNSVSGSESGTDGKKHGTHPEKKKGKQDKKQGKKAPYSPKSSAPITSPLDRVLVGKKEGDERTLYRACPGCPRM
jgi:hypothetical protein